MADDNEPQPLDETEPVNSAPFAPFATTGPAAARQARPQQGARGGRGGRGGRGRGGRGGRGRARSAKEPQPHCPHCGGPIQHLRPDPKHVVCRVCDGKYHKKCVTLTFGVMTTFVCARCNPDGSSSSRPRPASVPASRIRSPGPTQPHLPGPDPAPAPALATAPVPAPGLANDDVHGDVRDLGDSVPRGDTLASDTSRAVTVAVPASGLIYEADGDLEQLLIEAEGPRKPSYLENMPRMDLKLASCGFTRSPTQFNTPAFGDCGPEGKKNN